MAKENKDTAIVVMLGALYCMANQIKIDRSEPPYSAMIDDGWLELVEKGKWRIPTLGYVVATMLVNYRYKRAPFDPVTFGEIRNTALHYIDAALEIEKAGL